MAYRVKFKGQRAVYHCMTRTVHGKALFENREKEVLRKMIWQVADFSGVRVLTYCVMRNHFHVLVETPAENTETVTRDELLRRYAILYPQGSRYAPIAHTELAQLFKENDPQADRWEAWLRRRMGDVSEFMRTLKLRFTIWFNKTHETYGALWAERFKSVLVEGRGFALQMVAAYIDLNAVRAAIVEDPKRYRFCGYAEAMAGRAQAKAGLAKVGYAFGPNDEERLAAYGTILYNKGAASTKKGAAIPNGIKASAASPLTVASQMKRIADQVRCRCAFLTDGAILGTKEFVIEHIEEYQRQRSRKYQPKPHDVDIAGLGGLQTILPVRRRD